MTITIEANNEAEAAREARRAVRERRKAEKQAEADRAEALREARDNALKILLRYHEAGAQPGGNAPDAWEKLDPRSQRACVDVCGESGEVTLHGPGGSAPFKVSGLDIGSVYETPAGVMAVSAYERRTDRLHFLAVGMVRGTLAFVDLPEAVGAWLNFATDPDAR
jgi:hypothetical protein